LLGLRGIVAIALCCAPLLAQPVGLGTSAEYIIAFVRYVHWDGEDKAEVWHVCVGPGVPIEQDRAYANEVVRGKRFSVRHVSAADAIATCHVLDLTGSETANAAALLQRVRHLPILTVGNGADFCSAGGLMCLRLKGSEQKFDINLSAVKESGLNISARLLMIGSSRSGKQEGQ
jgi:hypothetical protein